MPLATPTITLADNEDGTGAVATIAGSTAGATNTVYGADWSGGMIGAAFASLGSRVGDGAVALAVANGYHWAYVVSTKAGEDGVASLVEGYRTTSGDPSVYEQCLDAVLAKLQAITLAGIDPANIVRRKLPWDRRITLPGIVVSPPRDSEQPVNSGQNDLAYDCLITVVRASNEDLTTNLGAHLTWRETIGDAFQPVAGQAALSGVDAVHDVQVIHGPVFDGGSFQLGEDAMQLTIRCIHRRNRGLV